LLGAGVIAVEGLNLKGIEPGKYTLVCLPVKIKDGDGAPARAILIK
jgi:arylformamidase